MHDIQYNSYLLRNNIQKGMKYYEILKNDFCMCGGGE